MRTTLAFLSGFDEAYRRPTKDQADPSFDLAGLVRPHKLCPQHLWDCGFESDLQIAVSNSYISITISTFGPTPSPSQRGPPLWMDGPLK